jgi:dCMP deaminase
MSNWDNFFLEMATLISTRSKDPSTQVGAVLVDSQRRVVSVGFNGFPKGTSDAPALYLDREEKYRRVLHAECNAILFADRPGDTLYVTHPPCSQCMAMAIQHGVSRVVYKKFEMREAWKVSHKSAIEMAREALVAVESI